MSHILVVDVKTDVCLAIVEFLRALGFPAEYRKSEFDSALLASVEADRAHILAVAVCYCTYWSELSFADIRELLECVGIPAVQIGLAEKAVTFFDPVAILESGVFNSNDFRTEVRQILPAAWRTE